jgi:large subunit ribosomal protein L27e
LFEIISIKGNINYGEVVRESQFTLISLKPGRVVVLLAGRHAGKKAIIVKQQDEGVKKGRKFPHALVAGIEKPPRKVTKRMGKAKIEKRSKIKPFLKYVNYAHLMPTRYLPLINVRYIVGPELDLKTIIKDEELQ